jgi:glutamine amidotransferase
MIHIVDYDAGNVTSVLRALNSLGIEATITPDPDLIRTAERIIFPGVGHAATAMTVLRKRGLDLALTEAFTRGTPILGICVGCQIILSRSEEGPTDCLNLIAGSVKRFALNDPALKIPHMGWNAVRIARSHPILAGVQDNDEFYFVHSYYPKPDNASAVYATCEYEIVFAAAIGKDNLFATQFHLEKSGRFGLAMLKNFTTWDGSSC